MSASTLLPQLHYFMAVVEHGGFSRTAQALHISQSAISYQVKKLETCLATPLFVRDSGQIPRLTPAGEQLADCCREIFARLDSTVEDLSGGRSSGILRVAASTCFGSLVLAPTIKLLRDRHPALKVRLDINEEFVDLVEGQADVAIRSAREDKRLNYQPLFKMRMVLAAHRDYLKQAPPIKSVKDLQRHCVLQLSADDVDWLELQQLRPALVLPPFEHPIYMNNALAVAQGVIGAVGIAYLPAYTVASELHRGAVVELLPRQFSVNVDYYAAYSKAAAGSRIIESLVEVLLRYLRQSRFNTAFQFM